MPKQTLILLLAGILALGALFTSFYLDTVMKYRVDSAHPESLQQTLTEALTVKQEAMQALLGTAPSTSDADSSQLMQQHRFGIQIFTHDSLTFWNNHSILPYDGNDMTEDFAIRQFENGFYLIGKKETNGTKKLLYYRFYTQYKIRNTYLTNAFDAAIPIQEACSLSVETLVDGIPVHLKHGGDFYIAFTIPKEPPLFIVVLFVVAVVSLCLILHPLLKKFLQTDLSLTLLVLGAGALSLRLLMITYRFPQNWYDSDLFNPRFFGSMYLYQSLGDLLITVLLVFFISLYLQVQLPQIRRNYSGRSFQFSATFFLFCYLVLVFFTFKIIRDLVLDSRISFDLSHVFDLTWYSLIGVLIIVMMFLSTLIFTRLYTSVYSLKNASFPTQVIRLLVSGSIFLLLLYYFNYEAEWKYMLPAIILFISVNWLPVVINFPNYFVRFTTFALIFANIAGFCLYVHVYQKEVQSRVSFASRLASQVDVKAEEMLSRRETLVLNDSLFFLQCASGKYTTATAGEYIQNNYLNNYLSKFSCSTRIYLNDTTVSGEPSHLHEIDSLYQGQRTDGICNYFRFMKSPSDLFGYLGRFEKETAIGNVVVYVLLQLRPYQDDNLLPFLITDQSQTPRKNEAGYSYAIYSGDKLMQLAGTYQYQYQYNFGGLNTEYRTIKAGDFSHLLYKESGGLTVVVTANKSTPLVIFANALCLLFFIFLLVGTLSVIEFLYNFQKQYRLISPSSVRSARNMAFRLTYTKYSITDLRYSTRIVLSILALIAFISLLSSLFTLRYIQSNIIEQENTGLITKLKSIKKYLTEDERRISTDSSADVEANLLKLGSLFNTEVSIYTAGGNLVSSSKNEVFNLGLLSRKINYEAYRKIKLERQSIYTESETIGNLQYLSCYEPFNDNTGKIKYIINIPYFERNIYHNLEISKFLVNFMNLYLVLTIVMLIIAYFVAQGTTRPFIILREYMKTLRLEKKNELLSWDRNDEIGELIKQYNKMVLDLEESKENLKSAERTGAWREMAKQVAHDIKNPLTPMKLNLQYLQKAIEANDPQLRDKYRHVAEVLIKQIDTLSEMANNFSHFAKAPDASPEILNVNTELNHLIELYKATDTVLFEKHFPGKSLFIHMDKNHFSRAIGNVIKNAIQSIPPEQQGVIKIYLMDTGHQVQICVEDNGTGIAPETEHLIFIPNFSSKSSGSGIGLSTTKTMIETAGGRIYFHTRAGAGTRFYIEFPPQDPVSLS